MSRFDRVEQLVRRSVAWGWASGRVPRQERPKVPRREQPKDSISSRRRSSRRAPLPPPSAPPHSAPAPTRLGLPFATRVTRHVSVLTRQPSARIRGGDGRAGTHICSRGAMKCRKCDHEDSWCIVVTMKTRGVEGTSRRAAGLGRGGSPRPARGRDGTHPRPAGARAAPRVTRTSRVYM